MKLSSSSLKYFISVVPSVDVAKTTSHLLFFSGTFVAVTVNPLFALTDVVVCFASYIFLILASLVPEST